MRCVWCDACGAMQAIEAGEDPDAINLDDATEEANPLLEEGEAIEMKEL